MNEPIRKPYNRTFNDGGGKPTAIHHVRVGGWAEVYVGALDQSYDPQCILFGHVVKISYLRGKIYLQISDEVCSPEKTGLEDGDVLEVELADLCASEFSPAQMEWKAFMAAEEERTELLRPTCTNGLLPAEPYRRTDPQGRRFK